MKKSLLLLSMLALAIIAKAQLWTQQNTNFTGTAIGVDEINIVNADTVWVKGFNGSGTGPEIKKFSKTINGGTTWTQGTFLFNTTTSKIMPYNFAASNAKKAFVIAMDTSTSVASFWGTSNGGTTWAKVTNVLNSASSFADGVHFWNTNQGFCFGDPVSGSFEIYTTSNGGTNWTAAVTSVAAFPATEYGYNGDDCSAIVPGTGVGFIMTDHGRVLKTTDYGVHWAVTPANPFSSAVYGGIRIIATSANHILCATYNSTSQVWTWKVTFDGGSSWTAYAPTSGTLYEHWMCYVPGTTNTLVASSAYGSGNGGVAISEDGGDNWIDFTDPLLQPDGNNIQCLAVGFYDISTGWMGNYDNAGAINTILKYYNPDAKAKQNLNANGLNLNIYPNPTNDLIHIESNEPIISVRISDLLGKNYSKIEVLSKQTILSTNDLNNGIYLLHIETKSGVKVKKIQVNK